VSLVLTVCGKLSRTACNHYHLLNPSYEASKLLGKNLQIAAQQDYQHVDDTALPDYTCLSDKMQYGNDSEEALLPAE